MKKMLMTLPIAALMLACKQEKPEVLGAMDESELKEFREWKMQQEAEAMAKPVDTKTTVIYKPYPVAATPQTVATQPAKKGWSDAAKGAVIGAATGAASGAVIHKRDRAAGAVVGGLLGAGGGYVIGRAEDRKKGRN